MKIVSNYNFLDIEDPNMLDKIDEKNYNLMKTCFCLTPEQKNIRNFCLSNSKEKDKEKEKYSNNKFFNKYVLDIHSEKKHYEGIFLYLI